jgi:unsaturated chondroitin disaccharide hydrolase
VECCTDRLRQNIDLDHHDVGFLFTGCPASGRRADPKTGPPEIPALGAADQLMGRFFPGARVLQAWGTLGDPEQRGRTIVDSLMNHPLLYWASEQTGDSRYAGAAARHAEQVMTHMVAQTGPPTTRSISIWTRGAQTSSALIVHGTQNKNSGTGVDEGNLFGD